MDISELEDMDAKPFLKWAGGKRQLFEEITERFPESFNNYHEPMIGGGAIFFGIEPDGGSINDVNAKLTNLYQQVKENPKEIITRAKYYSDPDSDTDPYRICSETDLRGKDVNSYYYQQRALFNRRAYDDSWEGTDRELLEEAALFLYLNRTCFNGLYRENSDGGFNVPQGRYANPDWVQEKRLLKASRVLDDVQILNKDFEYILEYAEEGDLVYFDPPYEPVSATESFTEYSQEGFGKDDQKRLLEVCKELDDMGVYFVLSNSGVMYDFYDEAGFIVEYEDAVRAINSDGDNRGEVDEIVATNVEPEER